MLAIETATINELVIEYHRNIRQPLCTRQDNTVSYYDRIVMNNDRISSRKYLIPDNAYKGNSLAQKKMVYKTQSQNHKSKHSYTHTNNLPFHGG